MNITNEILCQLYLEDLALPTTYNGKQSPKVSRLKLWQDIKPYAAHEFITIDTQRVWVWSDIHFFHNNIIRYANRPFDNALCMNDAMIRAYCACVAPDDVVIWNGDIAFKGITEVNAIINNLPGYKIHIVGNHDFNREGYLIKYQFDERHLCYVIERNGIPLLFTHYPMDNVPVGSHNLHGHIHQHTANIWNTNICVEHTNYAPVLLDNLMDSIITKTEKCKTNNETKT